MIVTKQVIKNLRLASALNSASFSIDTTGEPSFLNMV